MVSAQHVMLIDSGGTCVHAGVVVATLSRVSLNGISRHGRRTRRESPLNSYRRECNIANVITCLSFKISSYTRAENFFHRYRDNDKRTGLFPEESFRAQNTADNIFGFMKIKYIHYYSFAGYHRAVEN